MSGKQLALTGPRFKLYSKDRGETFQLYDLLDDPGEEHDLAAANTDRMATMTAQLNSWLESIQND